jgi:transposase
MIRTEEWMDIRELHRQGLSQRQIARETGRSRNTVAKLLGQTTPKEFARPARKSCLDAYKPYLAERFARSGLSACRLCEEIRAQGYTGSTDVVERFIKPLKDAQRTRAKATVRFETAPGEQAQADWAHVGEDERGRIYAFVIVLSFSRMLYVEFTRSMQTEELIRCHQGAFSLFGGVPSAVLFDNMAQVRLPGGGWNALFGDFALHYGFCVRTHRPYRPRTKGKVERMVDYLKDNFLRGRNFSGIEDLSVQGRLWQENANRRLHATTGQRPCDLLEREREKLAPLAAVRPYVLSERHERRVDAEGYVHLAGACYSVPPEHVGKQVLVVQSGQRILVRSADLIVAEHKKGAPGACVADKEHVTAMWKQTLGRTQAPPPAGVQFLSAQAVHNPQLSLYEEMAG